MFSPEFRPSRGWKVADTLYNPPGVALRPHPSGPCPLQFVLIRIANESVEVQ